MISLIDLITVSLALCAATARLPGQAGSICEQSGDFQLDRNLLYGEICLGKGVRNNREFVKPVFVICVNAYNGKDREKICTKKLFSYIR